jgi:hypothetical protein
MCSAEDWQVLTAALKSNQPPSKTVLVPVGEAKDAILASLLILYWTMKVVHVAPQIAEQTKGLQGEARVRAIIAAINARLTPDTPKSISSCIEEIVRAIGLGLSEDLCLRHIMTARSRYAEKIKATCQGGHAR